MTQSGKGHSINSYSFDNSEKWEINETGDIYVVTLAPVQPSCIVYSVSFNLNSQDGHGMGFIKPRSLKSRMMTSSNRNILRVTDTL